LKEYPEKLSLTNNPDMEGISTQTRELDRLGQQAETLMAELKALKLAKQPVGFWSSFFK
jgi:hypothetical protein